MDDYEIVQTGLSKEQELEVERQKEEFRKLLDSFGNRYWLWKFLSYCQVFRSTSVYDSHEMAIYSGRRDAGLWVLNEILAHHPEAFYAMQQEAKERENG